MADDTLFDANIRVDTEMSLRVRGYHGYATLIEVNIDTTSGLNSQLLLSPENARSLALELMNASNAVEAYEREQKR